jgi:hypothetical protein
MASLVPMSSTSSLKRVIASGGKSNYIPTAFRKLTNHTEPFARENSRRTRTFTVRSTALRSKSSLSTTLSRAILFQSYRVSRDNEWFALLSPSNVPKSGVDAVIHVASPLAGRATPEATIDVRTILQFPSLFHSLRRPQSAVLGTTNVLRQAVDAGIKRISVMSSIAAAKDSSKPAGSMITENGRYHFHPHPPSVRDVVVDRLESRYTRTGSG